MTQATGGPGGRAWSRLMTATGSRRLLWSGLAVVTSLAFALLGAELAMGRHPASLVWAATLLSALAMLVALILATWSVVADPGRALLIGFGAYLWPVPIAIGISVVDGYPPHEAGELLLGALIWPSFLFQGLLFCPLGWPCPLGR